MERGQNGKVVKIKSIDKLSQQRVFKMKSGQNGKWSKWKAVEMESDPN